MKYLKYLFLWLMLQQPFVGCGAVGKRGLKIKERNHNLKAGVPKNEIAKRGNCKCGNCTNIGCAASIWTFIICAATDAWLICCSCACFPASARVSTENRKTITMSELQVGESIQTVSSDGKALTHSPVTVFLKKNPTYITNYKSITTSWNKSISLSPNHLIHARTSATDKFNAIYANKVSIGDELLVQRNNGLVPANVTNVASFMMQGAYIPLTIQGSIIVDGMLVSCYPSSAHDLAHFSMLPIQLFPQIMIWIFGKSNESPGYVDILDNLGNMILPY